MPLGAITTPLACAVTAPELSWISILSTDGPSKLRISPALRRPACEVFGAGSTKAAPGGNFIRSCAERGAIAINNNASAAEIGDFHTCRNFSWRLRILAQSRTQSANFENIFLIFIGGRL